MVGQTLVDLVVAFHDLRGSTLVGAYDLLVAVIVGTIVAFEHKEFLAVAHALQVCHCQRGLTHREVVDRIDDVRLAGAIVSDKAVKSLVERELLLSEILEIQ